MKTPSFPSLIVVGAVWLFTSHGFMARGAEVSFVGKLLISPSPARAETKEMQHPFNLYGTHLEILRSAELTKRAELRVQNIYPKLVKSAVKVTANHLEGTGFVTVSGEGSDMDYTRAFIDALMDEYRTFIMEAAERELGGAMNKVIEQVLAREKQVKEKFARLHEFLQKTDQVVLEGDRNRGVDHVRQLQDQNSLCRTERNTMESLQMDEYLRSKVGPAAPDAKVSAFGGLSRPEQDYLEGLNHVKFLQAQRIAALKNYNDSHAAVKDLDEKIANQQALNEINRQASSEDWVRRKASLELKIASIEEQIMEHTVKAREANERIVQHQILKGDYERSLDDYKDWKKTLERIDVGRAMLPSIPVIFERAALATAK